MPVLIVKEMECLKDAQKDKGSHKSAQLGKESHKSAQLDKESHRTAQLEMHRALKLRRDVLEKRLETKLILLRELCFKESVSFICFKESVSFISFKESVNFIYVLKNP